jgi:deoxyribose-phosphate aldolase
VARACQIAHSAGADFVKTSTGFGSGSATPEVIEIMIRTVGSVMGVKASGGVRDYATACGFLDQGCRRLGTAGGTAVILDAAPDAGTKVSREG